jgi:streptomycin 6-kinase
VSAEPDGSAFQVPGALSWLERSDAGRAWLSSLATTLDSARDRFGLEELGSPFSGGNVSYVCPARRKGRDVVLKLQFSDRESRFEADALALWNGDGAVMLLDHAPGLGALLLERCRPGLFLADDRNADHVGILAGLLRKLHVRANGPFGTLADEAARWAAGMTANWEKAGWPCERRLVDAAVSALTELSADRIPEVLLHQDLHGHNVLSAERAPWLVIDPKPLVGDPAFALSPIVRSFEFGHSQAQALYRLDRLSEELGVDRERARLWCVGQTMAWSFGSDYCGRHFETARWLLG